MHFCYLNMPIEYYSPSRGGAVSTVTMNHAKELASRGHRVTVLTRVDGGGTYDEGQVVPIVVKERHELTFPRRAIAKARFYLERWDYAYYQYYRRSFVAALRELRPPPDVIVMHNDVASARYVRRALPNAKILVVFHNEQRTRTRNLAAAVGHVDRIIAVSDYIRDWVLANYPVGPDRVATVLNGVDTTLFTPRADWGSRTDEVKVLFVGRVNHDKAPDLVADAVQRLRTEGYAVRLSVAGAKWWYPTDGGRVDPYFERLSIMMEEAGAVYLGLLPRGQVPRVIREHDVVCVPSRWNDPCPLVLFEAMASGCALIAARRGGIPQACGGGATLFDPEEPDGLVDALRQLVVDRGMLTLQKARALDRARETTWRRAMDALEHIVADVAGRDAVATR